MQKTDLFLQEKCKMGQKTSIAAICMFLLLFGLAKNIKRHNEDNAVYKEIASAIEQDSSLQPITLAGSASTNAPLYLVSFYANLEKPKAVCPAANLILTEADLNTPSILSQKLSGNNIHYVFLAPAPPGSKHPLPLQALAALGLCLGEWRHKDLGPLVLYKVK